MNIGELYKKAIEAAQIFARDTSAQPEFRLEEFSKNDKGGWDIVISFLLPRDAREVLAQLNIALLNKFERVYKLIEFDQDENITAIRIYEPKK